MPGYEYSFLLVFFFTLFLWIALSFAVIVHRWARQKRQRQMRLACNVLDGAAGISTRQKVQQIKHLLRRVPRRVLDEAIADTSLPSASLRALSTYVVERWGTEYLMREVENKRHPRLTWERMAALRALCYAAYGKRFCLLAKMLSEGDKDVVDAAITMLGQMQERDAAEMLVNALRNKQGVPARVAAQLDQLSLDVSDALLPLLKHELPVTRLWAATLLSKYGEVDGVDAELSQLATDSDPDVRRASIEALGAIGADEAAPVALHLLKDKEWFVRAHAARALGEWKRVDVADRVIPLLADAQWWVRFAAKQSLQAMGMAVYEHLVPVLDHRDSFARNGAAEVLQNLGVLDEIIAESASVEGVSQERFEVGRKIMLAGGKDVSEALAQRTRPGLLPAVRRLLHGLELERNRRGPEFFALGA